MGKYTKKGDLAPCQPWMSPARYRALGKMGGRQHLDMAPARYALKPSSTNGKDCSACTVAAKEGMIETPLLTDSPLVLPRGGEHNATTSPIIGEDTTQPCKETKAGC